MKEKWAPQRKILAGAIVAVTVWVLKVAFGLEVPAEVASAAVVIVGYLVPNPA